jgi:NitT/TauT family transport system ATP-binding protein
VPQGRPHSSLGSEKIVVDGVSFRYEGRGEPLEALRNVSFACRDREIVALVGPSGCGKSTLVGLVAGLKQPSGGRILVDGEVVSGPSPEVGVIFQKSTLLPWRSVLENVELGLELRGAPAAERRNLAADLIRKYGLGGFERKYPHALSGGMQKRVALMQALAYNPQIIILDEAFAALDAQTRLVVQDEFLRITRETGKTVLMVTHDIGEAIAMSDRVIVFSARPGTIKANHPMRFKRPGMSVLDVTSAPEYSEHFRMIWDELEVPGLSL